MPTYVYKCNDCEYVFEARQRMTDDPLSECPSCDDGTVRRVINNVGVVFKGSGFYVTDNRNGRKSVASGNGSGPDGETTEAAGSSSGSSSEESTSSAGSDKVADSKKE